MKTYQWKYVSALTTVYLVATDDALTGVYWRKSMAPMIASLKESKVLAETVKQLNEYFAGKRQKFDLPLSAEGTVFQKKVWAQLRKIPYGKTLSYRQMADQVGYSGAFRAVGTANGANPIAIVVPCHRVIASNGKLAGFGGGLDVKAKLLTLENAAYRR